MTRGSALLACALACGIVLRLLWPADMEWKADEQRMFAWASAIGVTEPWPQVGMASGVAVPNPGLSVWLFVPLARVTRDPVALAQLVQFVNVLALIGFAIFGASRAFSAPARELWFAGVALMSVNPIAVVLARKIWAQSLLPLFGLATLAHCAPVLQPEGEAEELRQKYEVLRDHHDDYKRRYEALKQRFESIKK